jgi:hypothetical protein
MAIIFQTTYGEFGIFSNFSRHPVVVKTERQFLVFPTSEALYQSLKFLHEPYKDALTERWFLCEAFCFRYDPRRSCFYPPTENGIFLGPKQTKNMVYQHQDHWFPDWQDPVMQRQLKAMQWVLSLKLMCHLGELGQIFQYYGPFKPIIELSRHDRYWGVNPNNWDDGLNMLGRCWMSVRRGYFDLLERGYNGPAVIGAPTFKTDLAGSRILPITSEEALFVREAFDRL